MNFRALVKSLTQKTYNADAKFFFCLYSLVRVASDSVFPKFQGSEPLRMLTNGCLTLSAAVTDGTIHYAPSSDGLVRTPKEVHKIQAVPLIPLIPFEITVSTTHIKLFHLIPVIESTVHPKSV